MNIVNNLITAMESDPNLLVPVLELSSHALKAKDTLIQMVESVPQGVFLDFLHNYIKYNVEVFASLDSDNNLVQHAIKKITTPLIGVGHEASIYALSSITDLMNYYVGSASNTFNRISQHQDAFMGNRPFEAVHKRMIDLYDMNTICWSILYSSVNYYKEALIHLPATYELSVGETNILRAFTEFIVRILEQSLISNIEPVFNSISNSVLFTYNSWDSGLLNEYTSLSDGSRAVQIINAVTGEILREKVTSIAQASDILQISRNMANRYLNSIDGFYSPVFGCKITLGVIGMSLMAKKIVHRAPVNYPILTLPGGSLTDLSPYVVWLFKENKMDFVGPFLNFTEAARYLTPKKFEDNPKSQPSNLSKPVKRFSNFEVLREYEVGKFYIAYNPSFPPFSSNPNSIKSPLYGKVLPTKPF